MNQSRLFENTLKELGISYGYASDDNGITIQIKSKEEGKECRFEFDADGNFIEVDF